MYKSIYEEALEKIDVEFDAWDRAEHLELLELVEHALEKAQKQEKSLMIYKELANVRDEMLDACEIVDDDYYDVRKKETNLEQQIKELENDK